MITEPADWTDRWHSQEWHDRKTTPRKKRGRSKSEGQSRNTRYNQDKQDVLEGPFNRNEKMDALFLNTSMTGEHHIDFDPARYHDSEKLINWFTEDFT